jgi:hypothetical protein
VSPTGERLDPESESTWRMQAASAEVSEISIREADPSRLSHRLTGRHRTRPDGLDIQWTLTCGYGFWRTGRTDGIGLRIKRLAVRVCPSA